MRLSPMLQADASTAAAMVTADFKSAFNKDVLVRFYPDSSKRGKHQLIGIGRCAEIVEDKDVFAGIIERLDNSDAQKLVVKLRRGISFTFVIR